MLLLRPPRPLPDWWFDESTHVALALFAELNAAESPNQVHALFPFLDVPDSVALLEHRPWDGYVSLVEVLQLPSQTVRHIADMMLAASGRHPVSESPALDQAIVTRRDALHRPENPMEPLLSAPELVQLLLWPAHERSVILAFLNGVTPQELESTLGFEDATAVDLSQLHEGAPYPNMVQAAARWPHGVDHLRRANTGLVAYDYDGGGGGGGGGAGQPNRFITGELPTVFLPVRLEVRYVGTDLVIRVYPDDVHMSDHQTGLVQTEGLNEYALGIEFWTHCADGGLAEDSVYAAWNGLCDAVGPHRAVHVVELTKPINLVELQGQVPGAMPDFPDPIPAGDEGVSVFGLPPYWTFRLKLRDGRFIVQRGRPIPGDLRVGPVDTGVADPKLMWLVDLPAALDAGMAVAIPSAPFQVVGLDSVQVYGINTVIRGEELIEHLELKSRSVGVSFAPDGAATNNTPGHPAFYTQTWARDARWEEVRILVSGDTGDSVPVKPTHHMFCRAIGVPDSPVLAKLPGALDERDELARELQGPVYAKIMKPALDFVAGAGIVPGTLGGWCESWLRPHGPLGTFRIGDQPYGVLPFLHPVSNAVDDLSMGILSIARNLGTAYDTVLPAFDGSVPEVATLARTAYPSMWSQQSFEPDDDAASYISNTLSELTTNRTDAESVDLWDDTFGAFETYMNQVLDWLAGTAAKPSGHRTLDDLLSPFDAHAELSRRDKDARNALNRAIELRRPRLEFVPGPWRKKQHKWFDMVDAILDHAHNDDKKEYRPHLFPNQQQDNKDDAVQILSSLTTWGEEYRTLTTWLDREPQLESLLRFARNRVLDDPGRMELRNFLDQISPPPPQLSGDVMSTETRGVPESPDGIAVTGDYGWWLDVTEEADNVPGWWLETPADRTGVPLLERLFPTTHDSLRTTWGDDTLEWGLRAAVGAVSMRPSSWVVACSHQALDDFRTKQGQGIAQPGSSFVGGYGFLLDVPGKDEVPPEDSEGYMLAPSVAHAATAAVLRSGWLSRDPEDPDQPMAIHLEAARTRTAAMMLRAIGQGTDPGPWLGQLIEQRLVDQGDDQDLGDLRESTMQDRATPVDGFTALETLKQHDEAAAGAVDAPDPPLPSSAIQILRDVAAEVDAMHDLVHAEGVHQLLQRHPERAQVVLDALNLDNPSVPSRWDMLRPKETGHSDRYSVLAYEGAVTTAYTSHRARAAPQLESWLRQFLDPHSVMITLDTGEQIGADTLGLGAIDLVLEGRTGLPLALRVASGDLAMDGLPQLTDTNDDLWRLVCEDLSHLLPKMRPIDPGVRDGALAVRAVDAVLTWRDRHAALGMEEREHAEVELDYRPEAAQTLALIRQGSLDDPRVAAFVEDLNRRLEQTAHVVRDHETTLTNDESLALLRTLFGSELPFGLVGDVHGWTQTPAPDHGDLFGFARVRPSVELLNQAIWSAEAWALPDPAQLGLAHRARAQEGDAALVIGLYVPDDASAPAAVWEIDSWEELVPEADATLGVAAHVDSPASQAPAAWLISIPPSSYYQCDLPPTEGQPAPGPAAPPPPPGFAGPLSGGWTVASVGDLLDDVIHWLKRRGVGSDELEASPILNHRRGILPVAVRPPEPEV